jgi:hypothetical protein
MGLGRDYPCGFIYANPLNQIQKNFNKEALKILGNKKEPTQH